jgi:myo-inositol-1(or 4)-monophosphatase
MHGRRLATTNEAVCITSGQSGEALERLESWTTTHGIDLTVRNVGEELADDDYTEAQETLGIAIGGDGTFLEGVRAFAPRRIPLLGINAGTLAFLARIHPRDMDSALTEVLRGRATVYDRQQLRATGPDLDTTGVNDVMIQPVPPDNPVDRKICRLHVFVDDEYVGQYDGSGVAINTPTGSTGLALSADGPIHFPNDNFTLQITPLHTHMMGVRPMVVSESVTITVVPENPVQVLVDGGRHHTTVDEGEPLQVTGADNPAHIVRTSYDDSFMSALAGKLGWGVRTPEDTGPTEHIKRDAAPSDFLANACRVAREAAISAGEPVRELHGQVEQVEYKENKADIVTEADHQSDRIIATVIENEFPGHGIRSEESGVQKGDSEYTWLVDPLDGTGNFAHGNPNYSISIALLDGDDRPIVGVVHSPETDEVFHAVRDGGAYRNDTPIQPTARDRLDESMLLSGYDPNGSFLQAFYEGTRGVRRLGSAALNLCYVAAGSADAVWEYDTYPWDVAAGLCILREAGGRVTDDHGTEYELRLDDRETRTPLLASNGALHPALLDHLPSDRLVLSRDRKDENVGDTEANDGTDEVEEQPQEQD